jgi:hypothetical protein
MAEASTIDVPAAPAADGPKKAKKPAQKATEAPAQAAPAPTVEQLQAQLTVVTRQRDTLLAALNMLKTATDERIILTQAQLNEIGRQG